jgi:hypothetical protein
MPCPIRSARPTVIASPDAVRADSLPGVMYQVQPCVPRGVDDRSERPQGIGLVPSHADGDHPAVRVARGQPERLPGAVDRAPPGVVQDHLAFDVVPGLPLGQAGQHRLQGHLHLAQPLAVGGGGERDLRLPGPVRGLVGAELGRDPDEVLRPPQAVPDQRGVVGELAEVSELTAAVRDVDAVARADLAERGPPDRALQVDVQVGLGQQRQVTHGPQHKRWGSPGAPGTIRGKIPLPHTAAARTLNNTGKKGISQ